MVAQRGAVTEWFYYATRIIFFDIIIKAVVSYNQQEYVTKKIMH
jgi:hypothetical protein